MLMEANEVADKEQHVIESEVFERALNEVAKEVFDNWENVNATEKRHLRSSLEMGFDEDPSKFEVLQSN